MKPLLIIKTGTTFPSIRERHGDFEDFIIGLLPHVAKPPVVASIFEGCRLPAGDEISGAIITGSHSMVTDREEWSEYLAAWLRRIPAGSLPVLGICYGHQLLAHALGGEVAYHPQGMETGAVKIRLTAAGRKDPLLGCLPDSFLGYVAHSQTVVKLPAAATLLAENDFEPHHAFVVGGNMWGVQFHPEYTAAITRGYIAEQERQLAQAGHDVGQLLAAVRDAVFGRLLITRFCGLVKSGGGLAAGQSGD